MRTLEELKCIDDGGCFDRLVKKVEEAVDGDKSLKLELLTDAVLRGFIRKAMKPKLLAVEAKERNCGVEFVRTPKKISTTVPSPPHVSGVECINESIMKKPAVKRQRKTDGLDKKRKADSCLEEEEETKKNRRTIIKKNNRDDQLPPELPQEFKTRIERLNGTDVMLVIQKELKKSDLNNQQGRFAVPRGQLRTQEFLSEKEIHTLSQKEFNGIQCSLIQPCLEEITNLELKRWNMDKTFSYILIHNWNSVAYNARNHLEIGSKVQLWSFRVASQLWFALVKLKEKEDRETFTNGVTSIEITYIVTIGIA